MITNKISKLGVAFAMLGLGLLAACGESNVASSYSETQTGKPVVQLGRLADLDTSMVYQRIDVVDPCSEKAGVLDVDEPNVLAKASPIIEENLSVSACGKKETVVYKCEGAGGGSAGKTGCWRQGLRRRFRL